MLHNNYNISQFDLLQRKQNACEFNSNNFSEISKKIYMPYVMKNHKIFVEVQNER